MYGIFTYIYHKNQLNVGKYIQYINIYIYHTWILWVWINVGIPVPWVVWKSQDPGPISPEGFSSDFWWYKFRTTKKKNVKN